ncbi:MAG: MMPL family transporter, partial [Deltaproteobacteria bacterium]|nr:MMPL family transporter [Deltaproteobacteria bacterium]
YKVSIFFLALVALFTYGAMEVRIDTNMVELSDKESDINRAYKIVDEKMSGGQNLQILFEFNETDSLKDLKVLAEIDKLERHLVKAYPELVRKTFSLARMLKDTNRVMHGNDQAYYRIPTDQTLTNQLMYLLSNANPEDRRSLVNDNYTKTYVTVQVNNAGSYEYTQFFSNVQEDIDSQFALLRETHPDMRIRLAGALPMLYQLSQEMSEAQMDSFFLAILVISCIMMITLGSLQGGLISILPNVIPALTTFGAMGLMDVPLDGDTLFIAPVIIGLAVDDTIHLIASYRDNLLYGKDHETAIKETLKEVGQAVTFTTLILGLGFGIMAFSSYGGMSKIGIYGSLGIFTALLCDLFFLPALLTIFKPKMGTDGQQVPASYEGAR